jgi:hypothetical protein
MLIKFQNSLLIPSGKSPLISFRDIQRPHEVLPPRALLGYLPLPPLLIDFIVILRLAPRTHQVMVTIPPAVSVNDGVKEVLRVIAVSDPYIFIAGVVGCPIVTLVVGLIKSDPRSSRRCS